MRHKIKLPENHTRKFLIEMIPPGSMCVEIGVMTGNFSAAILTTKPHELHLIDPWLFEEHTNIGYGCGIKDQDEMDEVYNFAVNRFANQKSVFIHRKSSQDAVVDFPDEYFDFIYLDGNHLYDFIKRDVSLYLPKMKIGGLFTGDDYTWGTAHDQPVKKVINNLKKDPRVKFITVKNDQFIFKRIS